MAAKLANGSGAAGDDGGSKEARNGDGDGDDDGDRDNSDVDSDDDDAFVMRPASVGGDDDDADDEGDEDTGDGDGDGAASGASAEGKSKRASRRATKKYGLLTAVTAHRLKDRLDMMQALRLARDFVDGDLTQLPASKVTTRELADWWVPSGMFLVSSRSAQTRLRGL